MTREAMPSQKALSEKQGEGYEIAAEIAKIEPVLKGAQTRRRKAEYEVKRSQWILDHLTAEEEDRVPEWTEEVAKAKATLEKRQAKEDEYQTRLDELTDRRAGVIGEIKALQEKVNEERHAALAEQRERAIAVVEQAVKDHPLTAEYDLKAEVSGGGATVGWGEPYTGRDGKEYERGINASVTFPHPSWSDGITPASVSWSSFSPAPNPARYGAAIIVAAAVAKALDEAGIVDQTW